MLHCPQIYKGGSFETAIDGRDGLYWESVDDDVEVAFEYPFMNDVMRIVKEEEPEILGQSYDMDCLMRLRIRRSLMPKLKARLEKVDSLRFIDEE